MCPEAFARISSSELASYIRGYAARVAPGSLNLLDFLIKARFGVDAVTMFFKDSSTFFKVLEEVYDVKETALFMLVSVFIKPMLIKLNKLDVLNEAVSLAINDSSKFRKLLSDLGVDLS